MDEVHDTTTPGRIKYKECGDCSACCDGHLAGNIYGNKFGNRSPCKFLVSGLCSIYSTRPDSPCSTFQCAWSQHLLDDDLKPNKCGLLVYIVDDEDGNKKFVSVEMQKEVPYTVYSRIEQRARELNVKWDKVKY